MTTLDATQPDSRSVLRTTAATSGFVLGWYCLPDYVRSKRLRTALKTAGLGAYAALGLREIRSGRASADAPTAAGEDETDATHRIAALAGAALVIGGSAVLTVVVERWVFRRNEARAARGVVCPHTRSALLFAAVTAVVAVPDLLRSKSVASPAP